jgi:hypothetical protein
MFAADEPSDYQAAEALTLFSSCPRRRTSTRRTEEALVGTWIPAFAGMTTTGQRQGATVMTCSLSLREAKRRSNLQRHVGDASLRSL